MTRNHPQRAREAVRVDGTTWRPLAVSEGERCADCNRCDADGDDHESHICRVAPAWFAGELVVCFLCFRQRVREDVRRPEVHLRGRNAKPVGRSGCQPRTVE